MGLLDRLFADPLEPNVRLEDLLRSLARADAPAARQAYFAELPRAKFLLATPGAVTSGRLAAGAGTADGTTDIPFIARGDGAGGKAMLAFTGRRALLAWRSVGCDTVQLAAADAARLALQAGCSSIILNPDGPVGGRITAAELAELAAGRMPSR